MGKGKGGEIEDKLTFEDLHWFIRSIYWFLPIPRSLRPEK